MSEGAPWLTLVGIGEDGRDSLSVAARNALDGAQTVIGGRRHLELAGPMSCATMAWPSPIDDAIPHILALRGTPVVVLATGDPFHYGIGTTLARHVAPAEMRSFPQPSAFALAASRLCWSQQETTLLSLHGRDDAPLRRELAPDARLLVLSWDGTTPAHIAALLTQRGYGSSRVTVLEALGGPRERVRETIADQFALTDIDPLNTVAVECRCASGAKRQVLGCLPDDAFEHDGQITKQSIRAVTLTALAPCAGELLWDVGAGSGSVAIEWMRLSTGNRAVAIEARNERADRIARNASRHEVAVHVKVGSAPGAYEQLPPPDAVFIGGGVSDPAVMAGAQTAVKPGGRIVANGVTLEAQAHLSRCHAAHGGTLVMLQHAQAVPFGRFSGWKPAMPVVQWRWTKPL